MRNLSHVASNTTRYAQFKSLCITDEMLCSI